MRPRARDVARGTRRACPARTSPEPANASAGIAAGVDVPAVVGMRDDAARALEDDVRAQLARDRLGGVDAVVLDRRHARVRASAPPRPDAAWRSSLRRGSAPNDAASGSAAIEVQRIRIEHQRARRRRSRDRAPRARRRRCRARNRRPRHPRRHRAPSSRSPSISSGVAGSTAGRSAATKPIRTLPAPQRCAARPASSAAPTIPDAPPMMPSVPNVPLCTALSRLANASGSADDSGRPFEQSALRRLHAFRHRVPSACTLTRPQRSGPSAVSKSRLQCDERRGRVRADRRARLRCRCPRAGPSEHRAQAWARIARSPSGPAMRGVSASGRREPQPEQRVHDQRRRRERESSVIVEPPGGNESGVGAGGVGRQTCRIAAENDDDVVERRTEQAGEHEPVAAVVARAREHDDRPGCASRPWRARRPRRQRPPAPSDPRRRTGPPGFAARRSGRPAPAADRARTCGHYRERHRIDDVASSNPTARPVKVRSRRHRVARPFKTLAALVESPVTPDAARRGGTFRFTP